MVVAVVVLRRKVIAFRLALLARQLRMLVAIADVAWFVDGDGRSNWSGLIETLARTLEPAAKAGQVMSFSEIRMTDGTVMVRDDAHACVDSSTR